MTKSLAIIGCYMDFVGFRDQQLADKYLSLFLDNSNTGFAEVHYAIAYYAR